jgi:NAD(P)H dehydrogenase (quinone)
MSDPYLLVLYYSQNGSTKRLAQAIAVGAAGVAGMSVRLRTVPKVSTLCEVQAPAVPDEGDIYCSEEDLRGCAGLALGSPTRFGNMAAAMKYFWDGTANIWLNGELIGKPAGVFTSSSSLHGGQESTLLSMMLPLLHQGMLICGIPYEHAALHSTHSGGTPYGATHWASDTAGTLLTPDEQSLCHAQGRRLAQLALTLLKSP